MTKLTKTAIAAFNPAGAATYNDEFEQQQEQTDALIRDMVLEEGRIEVLAQFVLGYPPQSFHLEMMAWQEQVQEGLLLAWRGAAKTTFCTIARAIFEILHNPNIRILIVADAVDQAKMMLRQIKSHFTKNEKFRRIFGDYSTGAEVWSETEITVNKRTAHHGEPTIMVAGIGTALPSRHFDLIIADDLVTEDNAATEGQREKVKNYFYKTLFPTLMSPHGRLYVIGTRWHEEDLYDWLEKNDYAQATLRIGVLDEDTDLSRWEENFPTERMHRIRRANLAAFELQYMCRSGVGLGGVFSPEHFLYYDGVVPEGCIKWQAADLAIGQKDVNDHFAHVTLWMHRASKDPWLEDYRLTRLTFPRQVKFIKKRFDQHPDVWQIAIEKNAYQDALRQQLVDSYPELRGVVRGLQTQKDKMLRAQRLAFYLTDHPLRLKRQHHGFLRLLCGFPKLKGSKDAFDALDLAIAKSLRGKRRERKNEPGLL
jgi:hypothetical protein